MPASGPSALTPILVTTRAHLREHEAAWNALLARSAAPVTVFSPAWFEAHLDHKHGADAPWWCVCIFEGDQLRGVLPLVLDPRRGGGVRVPAEYFMDEGAPVLEVGREEEIATALLSAAYAGIAQAHRVSMGSLRASPLLDALRAQPRSIVRQEGLGAAIPIVGTFEDWKQTISRNFRRNLRKASNRIARDFGAPPTYEFLTGDDAPVELLDELAAIEQRGWKGEEGGAMGVRPETKALYEQVLAGWKRAGFLEWHRLRLGNETVALHMGVRIGPKLTMARICFDEAYSRYSPSGLLLMAGVERAFADTGVRRLDCVESHAWQHNWRMAEVPYFNVHTYRPGLLNGLLRYGPERIEMGLRRARWVRRLLGRAPLESA